MLISEKEKFIFIHIPKTGGKSLEQSILEKYDCYKTRRKAHYSLQDIERNDVELRLKNPNKFSVTERACWN